MIFMHDAQYKLLTVTDIYMLSRTRKLGSSEKINLKDFAFECILLLKK